MPVPPQDNACVTALQYYVHRLGAFVTEDDHYWIQNIVNSMDQLKFQILKLSNSRHRMHFSIFTNAFLNPEQIENSIASHIDSFTRWINFTTLIRIAHFLIKSPSGSSTHQTYARLCKSSGVVSASSCSAPDPSFVPTCHPSSYRRDGDSVFTKRHFLYVERSTGWE